MRILVAHNFYQTPGGEDEVFRAEGLLLRQNGHSVREFIVSNQHLIGRAAIAAGLQSLWSITATRELGRHLRAHKPDIAHFHNTFPLISPAAYWTSRRAAAAVVQTLHNFRLVCPAATLYRAGKPCHDCLGRTPPWPGVFYACYRQNRLATATVAAMLAVHRLLGTFSQQVDAYIALTQHGRDLFIQGGLPADRVHIKPNFLPDPGNPGNDERKFVLYAGRLTEDKGVDELLAAWRQDRSLPPLVICGTGPLEAEVIAATASDARLSYAGQISRQDVMTLNRRAFARLVPSKCYETQSLAVLESFARGAPVIAANHGALSEVVEAGRTGWLFKPGDASDLATKVHEAQSNPTEAARRGVEARLEYEAKYTPARNYELLLEIYEKAIHHRRGR